MYNDDKFNIIFNSIKDVDIDKKFASSNNKNKEALTLFLDFENKLPEYYEKECSVLKDKFGLSDLDCEKLLVCRNIFHSEDVFTNWHIFLNMTKVLNDVPANFSETSDVTPSEICWAIRCIRTIDPVLHFSSEVLSFISIIFHEDGFINLPEEIAREKTVDNIPAQFFLNSINKVTEINDQSQISIQKSLHEKVKTYCEYRHKKFRKEVSEVK